MAVMGRAGWSKMLMSLIPLLAVALFFVLLAQRPLVFFYMVTVPRSYAISFGTALNAVRDTFRGQAPLWIALGAAMVRQASAGQELARRRAWCATTYVLTTITGAITYAKFGGTNNSMIPALVSALVLAFLLIAPITDSDKKLKDESVFLLTSTAIALTFLPDATYLAHQAFNDSNTEADSAKYVNTIAYVRTLDGDVSSPTDPALLLESKGKPDRSIYAELDANPVRGRWPAQFPAYILRDLGCRDYIVNVGGWSGLDFLQASDLRALGFHLQWTNQPYSVWANGPERKRAPWCATARRDGPQTGGGRS
jgi:hypothetical protein